MKKIIILLVCVSMFFLVNCAKKMKVQFDYVKDGNFSQLSTFDFMTVRFRMDDQANKKQLFEEIKKAVTTQMQEKGFKKTSENPDLLIAIHGYRTGTAEGITDLGYRYATYTRYWRGDKYWGDGTSIEQFDFREGILVIDFVEAKSNEMIWRGAATRALPPQPETEKIKIIAMEAVTKILQNFPPKN